MKGAAEGESRVVGRVATINTRTPLRRGGREAHRREEERWVHEEVRGRAAGERGGVAATVMRAGNSLPTHDNSRREVVILHVTALLSSTLVASHFCCVN